MSFKLRFSALEWAKTYDKTALKGDLSAGLSVGVMLVPQAMAYALIAGVPPVYGLYSSLVPLLIYPILGNASRIAAGIVAIDMLIVGAGIHGLAPESTEETVRLAIALTAMVGLLHLAFGLLSLGFVAEWLSRPVTSGFMIAAPLLIVLSQLDGLVGVSAARGHPAEVMRSLAEHLGEVKPLAVAIGVGGLAVLLSLRRFAPKIPRALIVVAAATGLTFALGLGDSGQVPVVGAFEPGFPAPRLPFVAFSTARDLLPTAITLAILQLMVTVTLSRNLAETGDEVRPNRELRALGAANFGGSFFGSLPVSASISRTAVNADAGAKTPAANIVAAVVVGISLVALPTVFAYVPTAALAAIIIAAALSMVDLGELRALFRIRRSEGWLSVLTLVTTLGIGIREGLLFGVGASMAHLLFRQSRPRIVSLGRVSTGEYRDQSVFDDAEGEPDVLILRVEASVTFANAEWLRRTLLARIEEADPKPGYLVLDGSGINRIDATATDALVELASVLQEHDVELHLVNLNSEVRTIIRRSGAMKKLARHATLETTLGDAIDAIRERNGSTDDA